MLNPDLIDDRTLSDILENMPDGWSDENKLVNLEISSFREAFERFMTWNGIIGYESMILRAICSLLAAEVPEFIKSDGSLVHNGEQKSFSESVNVIDELQFGEVLVFTKLENGCFYARKLEV